MCGCFNFNRSFSHSPFFPFSPFLFLPCPPPPRSRLPLPLFLSRSPSPFSPRLLIYTSFFISTLKHGYWDYERTKIKVIEYSDVQDGNPKHSTEVKKYYVTEMRNSSKLYPKILNVGCNSFFQTDDRDPEWVNLS